MITIISKLADIIAQVDMDEVVFDFDAAMIANWDRFLPNVARIDSNKLEQWNFTDNYPKECGKQIMAVWREEGFFRNLKPIAGAVTAINEMMDEGIKVFLCSTPTTVERHCMYEKLESVYEHFAERLIDRVIFTKDKTVIGGDYLIDDKPKIVGDNKNPSWIHIHFDRGRQWGKSFTGPQLSDWTKWREVIK